MFVVEYYNPPYGDIGEAPGEGSTPAYVFSDIEEITGLEPTDVIYSFENVPAADGAVLNSGKLARRNLSITFKVPFGTNGDRGYMIERKRINESLILNSRGLLVVRYYSRYYEEWDNYFIRNCFIEKVRYGFYEGSRVCVVDMVSEDAYIRKTETVRTLTTSLETTDPIYTQNPRNTGFDIGITLYGHPSEEASVEIRNGRGEKLRIEGIEPGQSRVLHIKTGFSQKSITAYIDGEEKNYINKLTYDSKWLVAKAGDDYGNKIYIHDSPHVSLGVGTEFHYTEELVGISLYKNAPIK